MEKSTLYLFGIILLIGIGTYFFLNNGETMNGNIIQEVNAGEIQKIVLSQNGYNYKDAVAEAGKPISISADNSVGGCLRSVVFTINGKKYSKYLQSSQDTLKLPALSAGTYSFTCSMGMGFGNLVVQ